MTDAPEKPETPPRRKRWKVPRPVRRALLLAAWISATVLLTAEIVTSVRNLLS